MTQSALPEYVESISVREFYDNYAKRLLLRLVTHPKTLSRSTIRERSINRPALAVTGISSILPTNGCSCLVREKWASSGNKNLLNES